MAPAAPVFSLRALAMAAMLAASLSSAHAAIFEDGEARRAILEMRQRVDGLQLSQQRSAEEVRKLGEENAQLRRSLLDLQTQIETLRAEQKGLGKEVAKAKGEERAALLQRTGQLAADVKAAQASVDTTEAHFTTLMKQLGNLVLDGAQTLDDGVPIRFRQDANGGQHAGVGD